MRISEYRDFLESSIPKRKRTLAVGPPGIGKTFVAEQVCTDLGFKMVVSCLPVEDPSTIKGYPFKPQGSERASHCLFDGIWDVFNATEPTVWCLEDIGQASESVLKSVMRPIQLGELNGKKMPGCVTIIANSNDVGHGAGVYGMIEPLKSRFHSIIHLEAHVDDLVPYGISRNWPPWLLAYLRNNPQAVNDWKPSKSMMIDGSCPRGLEYLAEWDNIGVANAEVWAGCVGKGHATACLAFKELQNELPDIAGIALDPEGSPVPDNPSARFLVAMAIASSMNAGTFAPYLRYLNRMPAMFRACSVRDAFRAEHQKRKDGKLPKDYRGLHTSPDFTAWSVSDDGKSIMAAASVK